MTTTADGAAPEVAHLTAVATEMLRTVVHDVYLRIGKVRPYSAGEVTEQLLAVSARNGQAAHLAGLQQDLRALWGRRQARQAVDVACAAAVEQGLLEDGGDQGFFSVTINHQWDLIRSTGQDAVSVLTAWAAHSPDLTVASFARSRNNARGRAHRLAEHAARRGTCDELAVGFALHAVTGQLGEQLTAGVAALRDVPADAVVALLLGTTRWADDTNTRSVTDLTTAVQAALTPAHGAHW